MNLKTREISQYAIFLGVVTCLLAAIWSPEELVKWVLSAIYLIAVGKYLGLNFKKEKTLGITLKRPYQELNYLNLRNVK